jgi:hypothetical protein
LAFDRGNLVARSQGWLPANFEMRQSEQALCCGRITSGQEIEVSWFSHTSGGQEMNLIIRNAWFASRTAVDVGPGDDRQLFERCTFMGGTVHIDPAVDRQIFVACLFQGTTFAEQ